MRLGLEMCSRYRNALDDQGGKCIPYGIVVINKVPKCSTGLGLGQALW